MARYNDGVLERVAETVRRFAMFPKGSRMGLAVSGGVDSIALLDALAKLRERLGGELAVVHVNHGWRGAESDADEAFVAELATQRGLALHLRRLDAAARVGNREAAARKARYAYFAELIRDGVVDRVATGHTQSDQAETVLFRFLRGAGDSGLGGELLGADTFSEFKDAAERAFILQKLRENDWNVSETARRVDMPRSNLYKKIEKYGLVRED